jgi:hypothetical protein
MTAQFDSLKAIPIANPASAIAINTSPTFATHIDCPPLNSLTIDGF